MSVHILLNPPPILLYDEMEQEPEVQLVATILLSGLAFGRVVSTGGIGPSGSFGIPPRLRR